MEYDKINNLLRSEELGSVVGSESEANEMSKFVTREYVRVNTLSNSYNMKINQLDLKHLC